MLVDIDEELIQTALEVSCTPLDSQDLIHKIILSFIRTEGGRRLAVLGGKAPAMKFIPR